MTREDRELIKHEIESLNKLDVSSLDDAILFVRDVMKTHPFTYFSILKGRRFSKIWKDILEKTKFLDAFFIPNSATRIYYYINHFDHLVVCETCGKFLKKNISAISPPKHFFCSNRCA